MSSTKSPNHDDGGLELPSLNPSELPTTPNPTPTNTIIDVPVPLEVGLDALSSPITEKDMGIPMSPDERQVVVVDDALYDEGYDSDGEPPPWEGVDLIENEIVGAEEECLPDSATPIPAIAAPPENVAQFSLTVDEMMKMKVGELQDALQKRGLSRKGQKKVLQERLKDAIESGAPLIAGMSSTAAANVAGDVFDPTARWELLEQDGDVIEEPALGAGLHAPTQPVDEVSRVIKRNYSTLFDRPVFTGQAYLQKKLRNGKFARNAHGDIVWERKPHEESVPDYNFLLMNKLDMNSHPVHWFDAFLPTKNKRQDRNDTFTLEKVLSCH